MEDSTYQRLTEKLEKLRRNETQMSDQQKVEYADQLKALRHKITGMVGTFAREFILGGTRMMQDEAAVECARRIQEIVKSDQARAEYKTAIVVLFRTYSVADFITALLPTRNRVWYEGYAPYWCKHCTPYAGKSYNGKPLTFWNDIIEMGWGGKVWYKEHESVISTSLPPTMEQVKERYDRELQEWPKIAAALGL